MEKASSDASAPVVPFPVPVPPDRRRRGYRPREVARSLNVAPNVIYGAIHAGELAAWKFGRAVVIPADALEAWLESKAA